MQRDMEPIAYTERELAMFAALPRESATSTRAEQQLVNALRNEGFFRRSTAFTSWIMRVTAGLALLVTGSIAGYRYGMRNSLETELARADLALTDRAVLLQRASTAYVRAANEYARTATRIDSSAVTLAQQVMMGAALVVATRSMAGNMAGSMQAAR